MIPKRIYQIWFNKTPDTPIPEITQEFMGNVRDWCKEHNYEYVLIGDDSDILKECLRRSRFCSKYRHSPVRLSDYIRLYTLNKYGGIYLDTDVKINKGFNDFIGNDYFFCYEPPDAANPRFPRVDVGTLGFSPNNPILKKLMQLMDTRLCDTYLTVKVLSEFIGEASTDERYDKNAIWVAIPDIVPLVVNVFLKKEFTIESSPIQYSKDDSTIHVFDKTFFSWGGTYADHQFHTMWEQIK